jgi:hypothetical protein
LQVINGGVEELLISVGHLSHRKHGVEKRTSFLGDVVSDLLSVLWSANDRNNTHIRSISGKPTVILSK